MERPEQGRMAVRLVAMLLAFLAGQAASYRSGAIMNTTPALMEQEGSSVKKSVPSAAHRVAGTPSAHVR